jgi:1,4-alpha-glucan branching enzyme
MKKIANSGVWEAYVEGTKQYDNYKYEITTASDNKIFKADPYAFHSETNGATASKVYNLESYDWTDKKYYEEKAKENHYEKPMNIYEVNFASWKKTADGNYYSYKMLAEELVPYVVKMGYTHIEVMPLTEYPYDGSWGYQPTGYFSVTSRFGTPEDFRYFVNKCHEANIGVILDWVPAHFPKDEHGLIEWDGSYLYENQGWDRMEFSAWGTRKFDYGRTEVQSFLISSATFFIDKYHIDGIRVDAVASMLYLDYDKKPGEWIPNENGDNKNLEAIAFLQKLNSVVLTEYPNAIMIAEESTAWPMVTKPSYIGGLGFNYKWNIGWMNDTLSYVSTDPYFRKDCHNKLTFSMFYAFSENFILPISHDEVVYGKRSLLNKMFGDYDQKFDLMRTFLMYMFAHPGKKLTFMGTEFGQFDEWDNSRGVEFNLLDYEKHKQMLEFTKDLNHLYLNSSELFEIDYSWEGFKWLTADDRNNNIVAFERKNKKGETIVCVCNFSPVARENYLVGVEPGNYIEIFNTNDKKYGGNGKLHGNKSSEYVGINGFDSSIELNIEPNSAVYFKKQEFKVKVKSMFEELEESEQEVLSKKNTSKVSSKNIVTKIIEAKVSTKSKSTEKAVEETTIKPEKIEQKKSEKDEQKKPEKNTTEKAEAKQNLSDEKSEKVEKTEKNEKKGRGRPRKPVDPNAPQKVIRGRGRPKKPVDPNAPQKIIRGRGRPKKPVDPNAPQKIIRGRGRPKKPVDPNAPQKIIRGRGRPKKIK